MLRYFGQGVTAMKLQFGNGALASDKAQARQMRASVKNIFKMLGRFFFHLLLLRTSRAMQDFMMACRYFGEVAGVRRIRGPGE